MGTKSKTTKGAVTKAVKAVKPAPKAAAKPAAKPKVVAKSTAKPAKSVAKPKLSTVAVKLAKAKQVSITYEDIALRAYFIGQDRTNAGLPGNSEGDWLEAERQLRG